MASAEAARAGRLADLAAQLTVARQERDRRTEQYRALDVADVSMAKQARVYRKLRGARRCVEALEARLNARLSALGNYCVGDSTDAEEQDR